MNSALFAKEMRTNLPVIGIIFAVLVLYIATVTSMFDPALGESLNAMMQSMPELFAAFGMATPATTLIDFLLNYLYGFLLIALPFVLILVLANRLMIRYLDRGTMSCLLATPNSRTRVSFTLIVVLVTALIVLMVLTTAVEVGCAELMFPGELDIAGLMRANAGLLALWVFMSGLCFLSACLFSHAGQALWVGGGLCMLFFLMKMAAEISDRIDFLDSINPLSMFDGYGLVAGSTSAGVEAMTLAAGGGVLFVIAIVVFAHRDLNI